MTKSLLLLAAVFMSSIAMASPAKKVVTPKKAPYHYYPGHCQPHEVVFQGLCVDRK